MASQEDIKIVINADDKASGVLANVGKNVGGLSGTLGTLGEVASTVAVAGFGALVAGAGLAIHEFAASENSLAQLNAVLKSTGNAAGLFTKDITDQSAAFQKMTTYSDEAVQSAQSLLLTFTNIKGPTFKDATAVVLDMSTALGEDLKSASIQVGKALQDPILGITALRRVGVNFTDSQKDVIAKLVETGHTLEAQQMILKELNTEFGGSAAAAAETFTGKLAQLKNAGSDLLEVIGKPLVDAITPVIAKFVEFAQSVTVQEKIKELVETIKNLIVFLTQELPAGIGQGIQAIRNFIDDLSTGFTNMINKIMENEIIIGFIEQLRLAWEELWGVIKTQLIPELQNLWSAIATQLWPAIQQLFEAIKPLMPLFEMWLKVMLTLMGAGIIILVKVLTDLLIIVTKVLEMITSLVKFFVEHFSKELQNVTADINVIVGAFKSLVDWVSKAIAMLSQWKSSGASLNPFSASFKLPGFADGGVVPGPSGMPQLAVVHGGETVIPVGGGLSAAGGGGITINMTGTFLSEDAGERMANIMIDKLKLELRI